MQAFQHIDIHQTHDLIEQQAALVVDIRDEQSFTTAHIQGSQRLSNDNIRNFIEQNEYDTPVVVVCYKGISSQPAAQYLIEQGFEQVFSMDGGFEAWRAALPFVSEQA